MLITPSLGVPKWSVIYINTALSPLYSAPDLVVLLLLPNLFSSFFHLF
jgi:hypothetical protein